jgi:hypothetical protein
MREFVDLASLVLALQQEIAPGEGAIIAIEGHSTSGKTTLGEDLAERLSAASLSTDAYARPESTARSYVERLQHDQLRADLDRLMVNRALIVIEGIALRDTLRKVSAVPQVFVYVKRMSPAGLWADDLENYLESGRPAGWLSWTDRQSVEYHLRESPHERADMVYVRAEE